MSVPGQGIRRFARRVEKGAKRAALALAARLLAEKAKSTAGSRPAALSPSQPPELQHLLAQAKRILVVRQDNRLGNVLLVTPFLQRLREACPRAHIGVVTGQKYPEPIARSRFVDSVLMDEKRRHIRNPLAYFRFLRQLRRGAWELAFELSNPDTHSFYNCLLTLASGAPARVGFDHPRSRPALTHFLPPPPEHVHASLAPLLLLQALGCGAEPAAMSFPLDDCARGAQETLPEGINPWVESQIRETRGQKHPGAGIRVGIHVGGRRDKRFSSGVFACVIEDLLRQGPAALRFFVVAGPEESGLVKLWAGQGSARERVTRVPALDLVSLAHFLRSLDLWISCDTGPMHLAVAVGTPTLALFLRSNPLQYAPLGVQHRTLLVGARSRELAQGADAASHQEGVLVTPPPELEQEGITSWIAHRALEHLAWLAGQPSAGQRSRAAAEVEAGVP